MNVKICPLLLAAGFLDTKCEENKCAWWVIPYTIEGNRTEGMCAIEMIAMKEPAKYQV